jgi:UDP-N-acetylmuramoyl-L-alanyl-D-glutamate--2,6-diaminopimelate ligase
MLLNELISSITYEELRGDEHKKISSITADSRQVVPGSLFVAVSGPVADGHTFIGQALNNGAVAVVCEKIPQNASAGIAWIRVANSAIALGHLASQWYGNPSRKLTLVGVTGTNGKTTTATLLYEMAQLQGKKAGLLSTVENRVDKKVYEAHNTTPSPLEINKLLAEMVDCGCTFAAMEVSSHGMVQHRTAGLQFAGGIFTNLTRDHLDYHKTVEAYLKAKKSFFDQLPATAFALTNADDSNGFVMLQNTAAKKASYSLRTDADFCCRIVESRIDGMLLRLNGIEVETQFAGRFQTFRSADGVTAIVDYAHTPDALSNVLSTIAAVVGTTGSITTVTGAGGNRDHGKRPQMGAEAARRSQRVIITSDNPRDENPENIADDIKAGIPVDSEAQVDIIIERAAAIHVAITEAKPGDVVLVAGKGHEDYQEFENHRRIHFDDREQVRRALQSRINQ